MPTIFDNIETEFLDAFPSDLQNSPLPENVIQTVISGTKRSDISRNSSRIAQYDFTGGLRGKYARRYAKGTNLVLLEPDVAKAFPNAASVNESLRALTGIMRRRKESLTAS